MPLDTVFVRTRNGALALTGDQIPLSGGFRQILRLIDGKRDGNAVLQGMPQLDAEDLELWTGELMRQGLIAHKDYVPVDDMAFEMTSEMSANGLAGETERLGSGRSPGTAD